MKFKLILVYIFIFTVNMPFYSFSDEYKNLQFIDVNNPFINKIPIAIPEFIPLEKNEKISEIIETSNDYLGYLLSFTSYFRASDSSLNVDDIVGTKIDFQSWKKNGFEFLITAGLFYDKDTGFLEMELRLFDVLKADLAVGKRYTGKAEDFKKMLKRFASEIMEKMFGNSGLFESKIAFVSDLSGHKEIYSCDFDGANVQKVTDDKTINVSPSWSYDNSYLAYTSYKRNVPEIFIKSLTGKKNYIVSKKRLSITPKWMPGKFSLAAVFSIDGDPDIYIISPNGEILQTAVKGYGIDVSPDFSPNGKKMAFVSSRGGSPQIYIKDFSENTIKRLTFEGNYNTSPSWSPKGDYIAYVGMTKEYGINIYTIKPDGSHIRMLTFSSGDNEEPSWSPDGSLIVFSRKNGRKKSLHLMTRSGEDQRQLVVNMAGNQSEPAWSH
ncbi:MAG: Tol-Pal system beta propeller repeat protein TolB [Desulforegulaceae bacterium]|nr:Tol-Pal system beta propeller repeat protein TolB [Desulforegulaceae bacterium]